jgi:hypothetical protein
MKLQLLALALALITISAHAEAVNIQWNADGQFVYAAEVRGGGFLELCAKLPAGLTIDWSFTSSVPLESNVHYHEGKQVIYPAKHPPAALVKDQLIVKTEQDYCWMWSNLIGRPFKIDVQLLKSR